MRHRIQSCTQLNQRGNGARYRVLVLPANSARPKSVVVAMPHEYSADDDSAPAIYRVRHVPYGPRNASTI